MAKIFLIPIIAFFLMGCGHLDKITVPVTESETKDITALIEAGDQFNKNWPGISGYLDGLLGSRKIQLPGEALSAWDDLDRLSGVFHNEDGTVDVISEAEINVYEKGYVAGARARVLWPVLLEGIKLVAPDVFDAIGGLL